MNLNRLPVLALVGRPNVGKSTLFNRLVRQRSAIVHDLPGVTRDRNYGEAEWYGRKFLAIDTGGFEPDSDAPLKKQVQQQTRLAIEEADVILFLCDGKGGLNPLDRDAVQLLRKVDKPVFFAVNKVDTQAKTAGLYEFYGLGLEEVFPLSAEHGLGLSELMERVVAAFPAELKNGGAETADGEEPQARPLSLAVVGRPNVGKSTLVNRLLGYERSVVDAAPGTTRDALDSPFSLDGEQTILVDTAGIRRKARIADRVERYSVIRSLGSVDRGDLVIYLLDGPEGVTSQDAQILAYAFQRGKGLILAVNKWDQVPLEQRDARKYREEVYYKLAFVDFAPVVFISALTGRGVPKLTAAVKSVADSHQRRIQTSALNQALRAIFARNAPPLWRDKPVKFFYATQTGSRPPRFTLFVNTPEGISASYERYLIHHLRQAVNLEGTPIKLVMRGRRDEEAGSSSRSRSSRARGRRQETRGRRQEAAGSRRHTAGPSTGLRAGRRKKR
ncbi:MAG: ribosome biogenesis GTPase Der [Deltaproteobacteria bacterium RIFCSPLOWO2_12_FULL_60_19]|nr:MAG: ribosome biogenesis GTPase Der [Deltaproteobacteria bacterium RIFCSPLOWO2_12_FULL_60_19]